MPFTQEIVKNGPKVEKGQKVDQNRQKLTKIDQKFIENHQKFDIE